MADDWACCIMILHYPLGKEIMNLLRSKNRKVFNFLVQLERSFDVLPSCQEMIHPL